MTSSTTAARIASSGSVTRASGPGVAWFDEDWAKSPPASIARCPGRVNVISRGESPNVLVYSYSDRDPGVYYMLDTQKRKLERLVDTRGAIDPEKMPSRKFVRYTARDGMSIPAWLTLPRVSRPSRFRSSCSARRPVDAWRDVALERRGGVSREPRLRGARARLPRDPGLGDKLFRASFKQWGRAMQDDLDDGMDWLVKEGIADPARTCIMGASYGGYAVMMGLARNPDRWKCGVNYVGVTDIHLMFEVTWSDLADSTFMRYSARERIGDPEKDAEQLRATSPLAQAEKIRAPVLMAYGGTTVACPSCTARR
jgi:dipeptidyl aminopeptidase/acylaminoacyl peptidase